MFRRSLAFCLASVLSFLSVVIPASAYAQAMGGIPQVEGPFSPYPPYSNPWTTDGWSANNPRVVTDVSGGANVARSGTATVVADGVRVKIPVTEAVNISRGALAQGVARAARAGFGALGGPYGIALGIAIEYGNSQGVFQCASYGWCKQDAPVSVNGVSPGYYWINGPAFPQYKDPGSACAAIGYPNILESVANSSYYCNISSNGNNDYTGKIASKVQGQCQDGFTLQTDQTCKSTAPGKIVPATPPYDDPGFVPWLQTGQGNTPGRDGPALYDAAHNPAGNVESPSVPAGPQPTVVTAPPVTGPKETTGTQQTTNPDGSTNSVTTQKQVTVTPQVSGSNTGNTSITNYSTNVVTTTTTVNNTTGATTTTVNQSNPDGANSSQKPDAAPDTGPKECGSPGKPKCLLDETGTPGATEAATATAGIKSAIDATKTTATDAITANQTTDRKQATTWQFGFSLPSSCSPYTLFLGVVADYCRFQPIIHDLMSMVWYGSTFFAIAGMFNKAARGD